MKLVRLAALCALVWVAGCSAFDRDYEAAVEKGWAADSIEGPWEGRWQSKAGHGGDRLKALISRTGPETYFARFRAKYWGIFEADQEVNLRSTSADPIKANGTEDLGFLKGGWYQYEATITPERFDATYKSEHDHGDFNLARPAK
jgi:hypothetical protein